MKYLAPEPNVNYDNSTGARHRPQATGIGPVGEGVERICRPDSVHRRTGATTIRLGGRLPDRSSHLPARSGGPPCAVRRPRACLFDVAPDGVWHAGPVARSAVSSYLAVSPLPSGPANRPPLGRCTFCATFRRPGPRGLRRLAVSQHPALRSPDLPPADAPKRHRQRSSDPLQAPFYAGCASRRSTRTDDRSARDFLHRRAQARDVAMAPRLHDGPDHSTQPSRNA